MAEGAACTGYPAPEALWRLLVKRGFPGGFQAFQDAHWAGPEPESMADVLERQGHPARAALLEAEDLPFLEAPAMVELRPAPGSSSRRSGTAACTWTRLPAFARWLRRIWPG